MTITGDNVVKAKRKTSLGTNAAFRFAAEAGLLLIAQITAIIIARALGPSGKGLASLLVLISTTIFVLSDFGLTASGIYFVGKRKYAVRSILGTLLTVGVVMGLGIMLMILIFRQQLANLLFNGEYANLILILALGIPASILYNWFSGILRGQERIIHVSIVNIIAAAFGFGVLVISLVLLNIGELSLVLGTNATVILGFFGTMYFLRVQKIPFRPRFNVKQFVKLVSYGLRGQIGQILQFINYRFDLLVVNYFLGISSVGIYGVGAGVAQVIWQIPNALSYALYSRVSSVGKDEGNAITCTIARQSMLLSFAASALMSPIGYFVIPILFGESFRPAVVAMWLLLPGVIALSYYKTLAVHLAGQGHPEYYSYGAAISAVITLGLDFLLIPRMGINGAAIASSIAYIVNAIICIYWFVRTTGLQQKSRLFLPERQDYEACCRIAKYIMPKKISK